MGSFWVGVPFVSIVHYDCLFIVQCSFLVGFGLIVMFTFFSFYCSPGFGSKGSGSIFSIIMFHNSLFIDSWSLFIYQLSGLSLQRGFGIFCISSSQPSVFPFLPGEHFSKVGPAMHCLFLV